MIFGNDYLINKSMYRSFTIRKLQLDEFVMFYSPHFIQHLKISLARILSSI